MCPLYSVQGRLTGQWLFLFSPALLFSQLHIHGCFHDWAAKNIEIKILAAVSLGTYLSEENLVYLCCPFQGLENIVTKGVISWNKKVLPWQSLHVQYFIYGKNAWIKQVLITCTNPPLTTCSISANKFRCCGLSSTNTTALSWDGSSSSCFLVARPRSKAVLASCS